MNKKRRLKKREIIGKVQLIIGIILLVSSITGIIISNNQIQEIKQEINNDFYIKYSNSIEEIKSYSNETQIIIAQNLGNSLQVELKAVDTLNYNLWVFFILAIIISILFITQGLINSSKGENGK